MYVWPKKELSLPIAAFLAISAFIAQFGEDLNILTTYDGMFIAQFQDLYSRLSHSDSTFLNQIREFFVPS